MFALIRRLWRLYKVLGFVVPVSMATVFVRYTPSAVMLEAIRMGCIAGLVIMAWLALRLLRTPGDTHGSATFASRFEIMRAGLFRKHGVILGRKGLRLMRFARDGHLLTFAPTRSGKGTGCVIPNLLDHPGSVVVTDIKGENYAVTRRWRESFGQVFAIAPFNRSLPQSGFNPLDFIRVGQPEDVDDAALIADLLVVKEGAQSFWDSEAENIIAAIILHVVYTRTPQDRNLHEVWSLLMGHREAFEDVIAEMRSSPHNAIRRAGDAFSQKDERERSGVISTAQTHMKIWKSPLLAKVTRHSDFQLEDLKRQTVSLYVVVPPEMLDVYRPFVRLMVGLAVAAMTRVSSRPRHHVLFLLDEIAALGRVTPIEAGIGYLAGYGVRLWLFFQDLDQIQKTYSKWRSIIANCNVRQAFGVSDYQTAHEVSMMMGNRTVWAASAGKSGDFLLPVMPSHFHRNTAEAPRALMTPDEIMAMSQKRQLIFVQACRPILARKVRYFDEPLFRYRYDSFDHHVGARAGVPSLASRFACWFF